MYASRSWLPVLALAGALGFAGCSDDENSHDDGHNHGGTGATSGTDCGGRGETFSALMNKPGAGNELIFTLVSSDPAPPQIEDNVWIIEVSESGAPVAGATVTATAKMPLHGGHLGAVQPDVTELSEPGRYELNPVALDMAGLWQVTIEVTTASGTTDSAAFEFCIEG